MSESLTEWADDWEQVFDQSPQRASEYFGKTVLLTRTKDEETMVTRATVVGDNVARVFTEDGKTVYCWQLMTSEGKGLPIFRGMSIEVLLDEED
jgi:hypothetical protein